MERVGTLIHKLKEQFEQQAEAGKLLVTAQMLLTELQLKQAMQPIGRVAVTMPSIAQPVVLPAVEEQQEPVTPQFVAEPIVEKLEEVAVVEKEEPVLVQPIIVEEPTIIVEEPIKPKQEERLGAGWMFDTVAPSVPTLAHQEVKEVFELNAAIAVDEEPESHNERLKQERVEVATVLQGAPIKDLKKAIGINDRYLFINDLFRGDEAMYERSIKTINSFSIYPEAEYWIQREMKTKLGWLEESEAVKLFDQLVKRRFS